jgi:hypothetical protein
MSALAAFATIVIGVVGFFYVRRRGARKRQQQA